MALIKCTECGNMVSDKADRCPHCGCSVSVILSETAKAPENPPVQEPAQRPVPAPEASTPAVPADNPPKPEITAKDRDAQLKKEAKIPQYFIFMLCIGAFIIISALAASANQPVPAKSPTTSTTQTSGHSSSSSSPSSSGSSSTTNTARHSDDDAFYCATLIVEDYLKAPSTAKFCKLSDATVTHLGNGEYMVTGWVDAENSYGAMIRSNFVVTYTATEKGFKNGNAIIG